MAGIALEHARSVKAVGLVMAATGVFLACLGGMAGLGAFVLKKTGTGLSQAELAAVWPALASYLTRPVLLVLPLVATGGILFWTSLEFMRFRFWAKLVLEILNLLSLGALFAGAWFFNDFIPALPGQVDLVFRILIWLAAVVLAVPTLGLVWYFRSSQLQAEFANGSGQ